MQFALTFENPLKPRPDDKKPIEPPYTFENGTPYVPPTKPAEPFIPDRDFDGPAQ
jgi:hypothetical protein